MRKLDKYDEGYPVVNPYIEDPEQFLFAFGAFILPRPGSNRGKITERTLQLNRAGLCERRAEHIRRLETVIDRMCRETDAGMKEIFHRELLEELHDVKEYTMLGRALMRALATPPTPVRE